MEKNPGKHSAYSYPQRSCICPVNILQHPVSNGVAEKRIAKKADSS